MGREPKQYITDLALYSKVPLEKQCKDDLDRHIIHNIIVKVQNAAAIFDLGI